MSENSTTLTSNAPACLNLVDRAYLAIRNKIATGEFAPGWQLKIDALSNELGVSGTPIREAIRRLEHDLWIEVIPYRGAFVRAFDVTEIEELYEIRAILETSALRKAMPQVPADSLEQLEVAASNIREVLANGDQEGYMMADTKFHEIIVRMAGNERLSQMYSTLAFQGRCFSLGRTSDIVMIYSEEGAEQHDRILEVIRAGQTRDALRLLRQHLQISREDIRQLSPNNRLAQ